MPGRVAGVHLMSGSVTAGRSGSAAGADGFFNLKNSGQECSVVSKKETVHPGMHLLWVSIKEFL